MIIVDCKDVESILHELAIYVSDQVAAVPAMKFHQFVLAPIMDDEPVDQNEVITAVKEFLESIGEKHNFGVISNGNNVIIKSISGKKIEREAKPVGQMFSCAHCGHVTRYEVITQLSKIFPIGLFIFIKSQSKSCLVEAIHNHSIFAPSVEPRFSPRKDLRSIFKGSMEFTVNPVQLIRQYKKSRIYLGKKNLI